MENEICKDINIALGRSLDCVVTQDDLKNVKNLSISNTDIVGNILHKDINFLKEMPNLEQLSLLNFAIDDDLLYNISVKRLILFNCKINFLNNFSNSCIEELVVQNTYMNSNFLDNLKSLKKFICQSYDIEHGKISINDINNLAKRAKIDIKY